MIPERFILSFEVNSVNHLKKYFVGFVMIYYLIYFQVIETYYWCIRVCYGSPLLPSRFRVTVLPRAKAKGRENGTKSARKRIKTCEKTRYQICHWNIARKRGNEKTKLRNLNPLPRHITYFVSEIDGDADSRKRKQGFAWVTDSMLCIRVYAVSFSRLRVFSPSSGMRERGSEMVAMGFQSLR